MEFPLFKIPPPVHGLDEPESGPGPLFMKFKSPSKHAWKKKIKPGSSKNEPGTAMKIAVPSQNTDISGERIALHHGGMFPQGELLTNTLFHCRPVNPGGNSDVIKA